MSHLRDYFYDHMHSLLSLLLSSHLGQNSDGVLKLKKLKKIVLKSVNESGMVKDDSQVSDTIEHKVSQSNQTASMLVSS